MLSQRRDWNQTNFVVLLTLFIIGAVPALAEEQNRWHILESEFKSSRVQLRACNSRPIDPHSPFFVVTHGMGGTSDGDRFHRLADAISSTCPTANVVLVDWSEASCAKTAFLGFPNPCVVAKRIDRVGDEAAEMLCKLGFDPKHATFIGESFGNWVNARIANKVGGINRVLAMNPASEFGCYPPPDLCTCARISWSFHTYSVFDTLKRISHASILLETIPGSSDFARHTCGIGRLTSQLKSGDRSWLLADVELRQGSDSSFHTLATLDGRLVSVDSPRERPTPTANSIASVNSIASANEPPPALQDAFQD